MRDRKHIRLTVEIMLYTLIGGLVPLQYAVAKWGTPTYFLCATYSLILLLGFFLVRFYHYREMRALSVDTETGFLSRTSFDVTKLPDDLTYLLFIRLPNLDDFLARYGLDAERDAVEKIAQFISYAFNPLTTDIYRHGDRSLIGLVTSPDELSEIVTSSSAAIRRIYQHAIPFPQYSYELRTVLHVGILPIVDKLEKLKYVEYARFPLLFIDTPLEPSVRTFNKEQFDEYSDTLLRQTYVPHVISEEQVSIVYQPIQKCDTGQLFGYEALARPTAPEFKHIGELLADAGESGLYINLELCLTHAAIRTFKEKRTNNDVRLFLNFAPEAIRSEAYASAFRAGLLSEVSAVLEIVERGEVLPDIVKMLRSTAEDISALVALDDFGTGYSNHLALLNARPDIIKVSRELLTDINTDVAKQQIYSNIVMFARNLKTQVLAEGIETEEEFETLLRLGMDYAQGYFIGKPHADLANVSERSEYLCKRYHNS